MRRERQSSVFDRVGGWGCHRGVKKGWGVAASSHKMGYPDPPYFRN